MSSRPGGQGGRAGGKRGAGREAVTAAEATAAALMAAAKAGEMVGAKRVKAAAVRAGAATVETREVSLAEGLSEEMLAKAYSRFPWLRSTPDTGQKIELPDISR